MHIVLWPNNYFLVIVCCFPGNSTGAEGKRANHLAVSLIVPMVVVVIALIIILITTLVLSIYKHMKKSTIPRKLAVFNHARTVNKINTIIACKIIRLSMHITGCLQSREL